MKSYKLFAFILASLLAGGIVTAKTPTGSKATALSDDGVRRMLTRTIIPKLELHEASFEEAMDFLKQQVRRPTPGQWPFPMTVRLSPAEPQPQVVIRGMPEARLIEPGASGITVFLTNIPLLEALRYVTSLPASSF